MKPAEKGICPECQIEMKIEGTTEYHCPSCENFFHEKVLCHKCGIEASCHRGCGAVNYHCPKDGLLSKKKVKFYYSHKTN